MHEASAVEALVAMLTAEAAARNLVRITRISLVAGEAAGYRAETLSAYLAVLGKGGPLEGAALDLRVVRPLLRCASCGAEFERARFSFSCPACGGEGRLAARGPGFYVESIEAEPGPSPGAALPNSVPGAVSGFAKEGAGA